MPHCLDNPAEKLIFCYEPGSGHIENNLSNCYIGTEKLHEESNQNRVRLINFASTKNMIVGGTMSPHRKIHKVTWKS